MIPTYQECMLPLLKILRGNSIQGLNDITEKLSEIFNLSDEERHELLPSKRLTVIKSRASWAKTYLNKALLINKVSKGKYELSESGINLLNTNPSSLSNKDLMKIPSFRDFIKRNQKSENDDSKVETEKNS